MSDKQIKTKKTTSDKKTSLKNKDKKPNTVLWIGFAVILIPCFILLYIVLGTKEKAGEPVLGDRFKTQLDPAITSAQLEELKTALVYENAENIEVNLISATLRITVNTIDDIGYDYAVAIAEQAYDKVFEILPEETYFTNVKDEDGKVKTKMYDIEVQVYNVLKQDAPEGINPLYFVKSKSAGADEAVFNEFSSPINEEVANGLLNPTPPEVPQQEE